MVWLSFWLAVARYNPPQSVELVAALDGTTSSWRAWQVLVFPSVPILCKEPHGVIDQTVGRNVRT